MAKDYTLKGVEEMAVKKVGKKLLVKLVAFECGSCGKKTFCLEDDESDMNGSECPLCSGDNLSKVGAVTVTPDIGDDNTCSECNKTLGNEPQFEDDNGNKYHIDCVKAILAKRNAKIFEE